MLKSLLVLILFFYLSIAACAPAHIRTTNETGVVPKPSKGKSMVVFVRPSLYDGRLAFRLYDDRKLIGVVEGRTYIYYETDPGKHVFGALGSSTSTSTNYIVLKADLTADKTYYVEVRPIDAFFKIMVILDPLAPRSENWGKRDEWLSKCKRSEMIEAAFTWEKEYSDGIEKLRQEGMREWDTDREKRELRPKDGV
jgi:hypothetical protein